MDDLPLPMKPMRTILVRAGDTLPPWKGWRQRESAKFGATLYLSLVIFLFIDSPAAIQG